MQEFDYIVLGGGTAGCAVAGRLAEQEDVKVLLVEAGEHNQDLATVNMAGEYSKNFFGPRSWNIKSVPMPSCNNREIPLHRGRFLGGSSGTRNKQDYDDWNLPGWSGEEFFAAMRKAETFHGKDWFEATAGAHGDSGPVHLEPHDIEPISELMLESFQSMGLPYHPDMFSTGGYPSGCGHALRTISNGRRSTGADYVINDRKRSNLEIMTNTLVDKVNLEKTVNRLRATSINLVSQDGAHITVHARREIIVSGGAYCSPVILKRSGIGPKEELRKLGIDCLVDLPGVGKNLQDHVICFVPYEIAKDGLTSDHLAWPSARDANLAEYQATKTGFLSIMPFGTFAFARLDDRLKDSALYQDACSTTAPGRDPMGLLPTQANCEIFHTECAPPGAEADGHFFMYTVVELFSARSTGTVTLSSSDPHAKPLVDHNYFADPVDLEIFSEACHYANEIVTKGAGTASVVKGSWPEHAEQHHKYKNREEWKPWIREHCQTCYHPSGTCKMGRDDDPMAVLDAQLRVRGVAGLRVADCSSMPKIPNGHTQMPAYGVGEKCADFIKSAANGM